MATFWQFWCRKAENLFVAHNEKLNHEKECSAAGGCVICKENHWVAVGRKCIKIETLVRFSKGHSPKPRTKDKMPFYSGGAQWKKKTSGKNSTYYVFSSNKWKWALALSPVEFTLESPAFPGDFHTYNDDRPKHAELYKHYTKD
uniref:Uncharacterized protein n=1 Tax=Romanomermis culicivorax TaxID=13658 RepID=A0A915I4N2_ROMCU